MNQKNLIIVIVLALAGMLYLWMLMPNDVGVGADSVVYYATAQNLLDGEGLTIPFSSTFAGDKGELVTHFPPLYPAILAILGWLLGNVATGAWLLSIVLFGCLILTVGWIMRVYCPKQSRIPVIAAFLTVTSGTVIRLHTVALSEPIFILCWLIGFFLLDRYLHKPHQKTLILSAFLVGLSFLTRFGGIAFIATACLWVLYRRGWKTTLTFGLVALSPMVGWLAYSNILGNATNRTLAVHWISSDYLWRGVYTLSAWLSPDSLPLAFRIVVWLVTIGGLAWLILNRQFSQTTFNQVLPDFFKLLLLTIVIYLAQIVLTISFLDAQVIFSPRILSPVYFSLMLTLLYGVSVWWRQALASGRRVVTAVGAVFCLAYLIGAVYIFVDIQQNGEYYTTVEWRDSETLAYLQTLDNDIPLVSNGSDLIYYYANRSVEDIPAQFKHTSLQPNEHYKAEMALLAEKLQAGSQLVYFHRMQWRWYLPNKAELTDTLPLRVTQQFADGTIYVWDGE